jgi:hypothetical protein
MHLLQEEQCLIISLDAWRRDNLPIQCDVSIKFNKSVGGDNYAFYAKLLCVQTVFLNEVFDNLSTN